MTMLKRKGDKAKKRLVSITTSSDDLFVDSASAAGTAGASSAAVGNGGPGAFVKAAATPGVVDSDSETSFSGFTAIFNRLKSSHNQERKAASFELKNSLISLAREVSTEHFQRFSNELNNKIFELIHGSDSNEKLGGVLAVNTLIDFYAHTDELPNQTSRLANYLRVLIPSNDIEVMRAAAAALGKLAMPGGTLTSDFVEFEVKTCIEWLTTSPENSSSNSKQEYRKHASLLIITAIADNSPYLLYPYLNSVLDNIWRALRDTKLVIRIDAAITLRHCLSIINDRDSVLTNRWVQRLFKSCAYGLNLGTLEAVHGTLLVYRELMSLKGPYLYEKFNEIYETTMRYKDHKSPVIRKEIYAILPLLASFDSDLFTEEYLDDTMVHYLTLLKNVHSGVANSPDRAAILVSIGDIAFQVRSNIAAYLDSILDNIRDGFLTKHKSRKHFESELFYCIAKLACAVGPILSKYLHSDLLDLMLACPLSDYMQDTLETLNQELPALEPLVNEKLLDLICYNLSGDKFRPPGSPTPIKHFSNEKARAYRDQSWLRKTGDINDSNQDALILTQALRMLATINHKYSLAEFVRLVVISYIEHENPQVRKLAALTSCDLFVKENVCQQTSLHALNAVAEVLSKLLTVAITDPVAEIRHEILKHLDSSFDPQLSQPDNARLLFMALNDEVFIIQMQAMKIVGRLASVNPAYIVPSLRKTLIQLLTELKHSSMTRKKEESASMFCTLISSSKDVTRPYIESILDVLLPKCQDSSSAVASTALQAVGELSVVGGENMKDYLDKLMPLIINTFQDQSNSFKRSAALKTLGQLSASSGYVIDPLLDYPQLLGVLVNILKAESSQSIRRETVRLIGILGALDPYKHREVERTSSTPISVEQNAPSIDVALLMQGMSPSNEEYYPTVVINTLMKILKDPSLSSHHTAVIQAVMHIFQTLGLRCVSFLKQIIPGMINVMRSCPPSILEFYFQQLGVMVSIVKQHIRPYVDEIFEVIKEFFPFIKLQITIISVIESISKSLEGEFKPYLPTTLTLFLDVLEKDNSNKKIISIRILKSLVVFGPNLDDYIHLVIPSIVRMCEYGSGNLNRAAIVTIGRLAKSVNLSEMSSRIVQTMIRVLNVSDQQIIRAVMNTLSLLLLQLSTDFTVFIPIINKTLVKAHIQHSIYDQLVGKLMNNEPLPTKVVVDKDFEVPSREVSDTEVPSRKLPVNQAVLKSAWDCSQQRTKEDWQEWMRRLSIQLLKESPSHALRACSGLAGIYYPLARELFNASFASCWTELYTQYQEDLVKSLCSALSSPNNPPEIHQTLLNLVEFLEHDDKSLPISIPTLGEYAQRCHAYAKALHYKELEFIQEPSTSTIESLISINNQLHQTDAAIGILKHAQQHHDLQLKETWYEKLQRWDDALNAYNQREAAGEDTIEVTMGKMRSLHALGEWEQLSQLGAEKWANAKLDIKRIIAPLAAAAEWGLGHWDSIEKYINVMKPQSPDKEFFDAILCLHSNDFEKASEHIFLARDLLVTEMSALVNESYNRAYSVVVRSQMIAELEEIIQYKKLPQNSEKRAIMRKTWNHRLLGCQKNVDVWQRILRVRSLVVKPKQDMQVWIKFANLCRKSGRMGLAQKALNSLLEEGGDPEHPNTARAPPPVVYAQLKYMWATGSRKDALRHLISFTSRMAHDLGLDPSNMIAQNVPHNSVVPACHIEEYTKLLARCFLKQGEWRVMLQPKWRTDTPDAILGSYLLATHFDNTWYKAWHNWALANFEVISLMTDSVRDEHRALSNETESVGQTDGTAQHNSIDVDAVNCNGSECHPDLVQRHVVPAIKGFFHSISLSESNSLQDTLRLLTLWFTFGGIPEAAQAMHEGFNLIKIDNWLEVIPQLISRIHQPNQTVSRSLLSLLSDLGKAHPQALVFPLTVAIKSESVSRQRAALSIMEKMRMHSSNLVEQAELVSNELIRIAVLWHELWYEGLEDASRQFFGEHNTEKMFATLEPLHEMLKRGPETLREISFQNSFGRDLNDAYEWVMNYKRTQDISNLDQAWDIYYNVFRRISRQLPQLQTLDLQHVSPKLLAANDLELAVPGTYSTGKPVVRISYFEPVFSVISSKQRPRRLSIKGSDGKDYQYALKGHEDIRQDSLVMQLFGLVNTLLQNDSECFRRHLDIQKYPAIPLSPKSGLLGWVPNSDTFHVLIRGYRESRKIQLNLEHRIMLQMAPDYDNLTLLQKVEVFTYALDNTKGQDLYKVLWLKSRSSESWLERRTTYTRSLAVMSMVGYILGLGDRHPSNLMLDRITGKVVHIDFGDCFEAAILREKYPEKVPFRLTRMLTYAMEVSGIEGSFRITCENVMKVLRDNKESLMAILEAFAHDPLINWGFDLPTQAITEQTGIQLPVTNPSELLRNGVITAEEAARMEVQQRAEIRNARATLVLKRITDKLTGNDFRGFRDLDVPEQVDKLIQQATSVENLCQHYIGWCSFW
ncbi:AFR420Wp [Eremothecium gossypii ATCC 10895]|uniref:Serine/threonine-protein kinase TOR n=1 Tax=Eremothecium gossypii (strain ATCC 10895 / CBS 109.51 / FGSC 9923 / NRRL Y-1056) TaxID=284811 RepID=Q753A4_EREGS|nr:AFR420Wp [Eremothecium gossypii ATCC 10895]AAS53791.2 AFR420Wp [Eremothecium gossypii ATCC 10895]AEY98103.1 FAFR420Wp [Eremothecium gossypii FDAG1]